MRRAPPVAQGFFSPGYLGGGHLGTELRDELLNGEIFYGLKETQIVIEQWRKHYKHDQTALGVSLSAASAADIRALGSPPR
jgi:hypothetical protein